MSRSQRGWNTHRRNKPPSIAEDISSAASSSANHLFGADDSTAGCPSASVAPFHTANQCFNQTQGETIAYESDEESERPGAYAIYRLDRNNSFISLGSRGWDPTIHSDGATSALPPPPPQPIREPSIHNTVMNDISWESYREEWTVEIPAKLAKTKWYTILCAVFSVGLAAGLVFFFTSGHASKSAQLTSQHGKSECEVALEAIPEVETGSQLILDPFLQCKCFARIRMSPYVHEIYNSMKGYEVFYEHLDSSIPTDSCHEQNIALVWIAGEGATLAQKDVLNIPQLVQRFTLAFLYARWGGEEWRANDEWLSSSAECTWHGVECDGQSIVTSLSLSNNKIIGSIETGLGLLTGLKVIDLRMNHQLNGTIPIEVWKLPRLEELLLGNCDLDGSIPYSLASYTPSLKKLLLSANNLTGPLPSLAGLSNLSMLCLDGTELSGTLSASELMDLRNLEKLDLRYLEGISGSIPSTIGLLTKLKTLDLSSTSINGTVPESIGNALSLEYFGAWPGLEGSLPTSIGNLELLTELHIQDNSLIGAIPSEMGRCARLEILMLKKNLFEGTLPSQLAEMKNLKTIDITSTLIVGPLPAGVCEISGVKVLVTTSFESDQFRDCTCCVKFM